jgi:hypothetical protein
MRICPHAIIRVTEDVTVMHCTRFTPRAYVFHFECYAYTWFGGWA